MTVYGRHEAKMLGTGTGLLGGCELGLRMHVTASSPRVHSRSPDAEPLLVSGQKEVNVSQERKLPKGTGKQAQRRIARADGSHTRTPEVDSSPRNAQSSPPSHWQGRCNAEPRVCPGTWHDLDLP